VSSNCVEVETFQSLAQLNFRVNFFLQEIFFASRKVFEKYFGGKNFMATIDRFKTALRIGISFKDGENLVPLTAQMKYDYLAAVHTMDQLTNLANEFEERKKRRDALREKLSDSCRKSLKKIADGEETLTVKHLDSAIKGLREFRDELIKMESIERESEKLAKFIEDGVSAGH